MNFYFLLNLEIFKITYTHNLGKIRRDAYHPKAFLYNKSTRRWPLVFLKTPKG